MTDLSAFERRLSDHFATEVPRRAPDHVVDRTLARVGSTRQVVRIGRVGRLTRFQLLGLAATVGAVGLLAAAAVVGGSLPDTTSPDRASTAPSPAPSFGPDSTLNFTSTVYGYSIDYPWAWTASRATRPWTDEELWPEPWFLTSREIADVMDGPGAWRLEVVGTELANGVDLAGYVASGAMDRPQFWSDPIPERAEGPFGVARRACRIRNTQWVFSGWVDRWSDGTVGGNPALIRHACGIYDAVVIVGDRAYVFSLQTPTLFGYRPGGPTFEELISSVRFER
jgi:hypothetical protein